MSQTATALNPLSSLPYILPFALCLLLTQVPMKIPSHYPGLHGICVLLVGLVTIGLLRGKGLTHLHGNILPGILFGIGGILLWILLCNLQIEARLIQYLPAWLQPASHAAFNPFAEIASPLSRWSFIAMRILGMAVLVPFAEELFWRGFLLRWIISPKWQQVATGSTLVQTGPCIPAGNC